jgi:hypothetical protein
MAGLLNILGVTGSSPNWSLQVASTAGITVGDYVACSLAGLPVGRGAPYRVANVPDTQHIDVVDDLQIGGGTYGQPGNGSAQFFTPLPNYKLSLSVNNGPHWAELIRRDNRIDDAKLKQLEDNLAMAKVSATDTTAAYLEDKLTAGAHITLTKMGSPGDEHLQISAGETPELYDVKAISTDTTPGFLDQKLLAGANVTLTPVDPTGNAQLQIDVTIPPQGSTKEIIRMRVDSVAGVSPPVGTLVTTQAEYDALGADLLYVQDSMDILPPILGGGVVVTLAAGTHIEKPEAIAPSVSGLLIIANKTFTPYHVFSDAPEFATPGIEFSQASIIFIGDGTTIQEASQTGTSYFHSVVRDTGTWTVDEHRGHFVNNISSGERRVIQSNTTDTLMLGGEPLLYDGSACTFQIETPAAIMLSSPDGVYSDVGGILIYGASGANVKFFNIQYGTPAIRGPILQSGGIQLIMEESVWFGAGSTLNPAIRGRCGLFEHAYFEKSYLDVSAFSGLGCPCLSSCLFRTGVTTLHQSVIYMYFIETGLTIREGGELDLSWSSIINNPSLSDIPIILVEVGGVLCSNIGGAIIEGGGQGVGISISSGVCSRGASAGGLSVNNCNIAVDVYGGGIFEGQINGADNDTAWRITGSALVTSPFGVDLFALTNEIDIDGEVLPYTDVPNVGDWIQGQSGSRFSR